MLEVRVQWASGLSRCPQTGKVSTQKGGEEFILRVPTAATAHSEEGVQHPRVLPALGAQAPGVRQHPGGFSIHPLGQSFPVKSSCLPGYSVLPPKNSFLANPVACL